MEYEQLVAIVEAQGYFAQVREHDNGFTDVVCNSARDAFGSFHGNSFRVECSARTGQWFVATWAPEFYRVPNPADVPAVCLAVLSSSNRPVWELDRSIIDQFGLEHVSREDYDRHHA
jgi:hypothetical protein